MEKIVIAASLLALLLTACAGGDVQEAPASQPTAQAEQAQPEPAPEVEPEQGSGQGPEASQEPQVATAGQMAEPEEVVEAGMVPVYAESLRDGTYAVTVGSSSKMFQVEACELTVADGKMSAVLHMGGTGYLKVFMGTGEEAANAADAECIPFHEEADGTHTFMVPVEALDAPVACAAYSKKKELWYDRSLVFRADSLPLEAFAEGVVTTVESLSLADGAYSCEVTLSGGSGRAKIESPARFWVTGGMAVARIVWSSKNYDHMRVGEEEYMPLDGDGNAAFEIPFSVFDRPFTVYADTTAMSTPHEIEYTLCFDSASITASER